MEELKEVGSTDGCQVQAGGNKRSWTLPDEEDVENSEVVSQNKKLRKDSSDNFNTIQVEVASLKWPQPINEVCVWNCRGLRGASTISQLKESVRFHLPDFVFVCETKNKRQ